MIRNYRMSEPENFPGVAPRKYLRKGQGTARFGMQNQPAAKTAAQSPMIHLPRFTPSSSIPNSARTIDSGISNEDETRPPTNSSLPIDRSSSSPQRAQRNRQPIVEEHEEHDDDVIEAVSALPTFIPDSGASSLIEPATEQSGEALNLREDANAMLQRGRTVQT
uniref:Uncharacterized protein n=2 Tax=Caenorhabditis japonica TaxID=281687 RepID=A0A8R1I7B3_CAEJA